MSYVDFTHKKFPVFPNLHWYITVFKLCKMYTFTNKCIYILKVPRLVKVTQAESPYFKIISPHNVGHKVGPGLPTTFRIQFTPDENKVRNQY